MRKTATKLPHQTRLFIEQFSKYSLVIRDRVLARKYRKTELRTKKNNHLAIAYDELGNAFALCADGFRRQLFENEINTNY